MSNQPWGPYDPNSPENSQQPEQQWGQQDPYGRQVPYQGDPYGQNPYGAYGSNPYAAGPAVGRPRPSVSLPTAVKLYFKNYATFSGRASRSEYWWVVLFNTLVAVVLTVLFLVTGGAAALTAAVATTDPDPYALESRAVSSSIGVLPTLVLVIYSIYVLAIILPTWAISWRRFHDTDKSGAMYFLNFIPWVGGIIVLILLAMPSSPSAWQRWDNGRIPAEG